MPLFHIDVPPHASAAAVESSLDQLIPVEFRADLVLELRDATGAIVLAIVLEVQRDEDPDKKYSWPVYVAVVRARKRCGTVVLVVAPDAPVATWAAENIDLGLGCGNIKPVVLGPAAVPHLQRTARAHAAGSGGAGHGTADRRQGNFPPVRAAAHRARQDRARTEEAARVVLTVLRVRGIAVANAAPERADHASPRGSQPRTSVEA